MKPAHTLFSADRIAAGVQEVATQLRERLGEDVSNVRFVGLIRGCVFFYVDLIRAMGHPDVKIDLIQASSYADAVGSGRDATQSAGTVTYDADAIRDIAGSRIVLIDDIIDTGRTLKTITEALGEAGAAEVITVALLDKRSRRLVDFHADIVGFVIPDEFVIGYGLDYEGQYRTLPDIRVMGE